MLEVVTHFPTAKPQSLFAPWTTVTYASDIKIPSGEGDDLWEQKSETENIAGEAISRLTIKPGDGELYLHLWHGRNHLDSLEDWGFNGPCLGPLKQMVYPSDKFTHWEDNLRAIGLTLEALRAVERHGATYDGQQYKGWLALPESTDGDPVKTAARLLLLKSKKAETRLTRDNFNVVWRAAILATHPDGGGTKEECAAVVSARDLIRERMGW